jgi:hypothetical protein
MARTKRRILSLEMVDPGWRAVYRTEHGISARELAAWALVERHEPDADAHVGRVGLVVEGDAAIVFADELGEMDLDAFCGYAPPGVDIHAVDERASGEDPATHYVDVHEICHASMWFG